MRIGIVCPYSLSVAGGVQGQVLALARSLRDLGHEARVLAPCDGPPPDSMVTPLGKSVPTASNGSMSPIAPDPACVLRTIGALRSERFEVLHVHEPLVPGPSITSLMVANVPVVATFHAAGTRTAYTYLPWATKRAAKKIKVRVAVSKDAQLTAQKSLGGRYEVLYNGIDVPVFAEAEPWPKEAPTILFVGRHEPRKGLGLLIDAMAQLPPDVRLWIAGQGPQTAALRAKTRGDMRIEWLGPVTDAEKARRMRGADIFCAPSTGGESFGVVLLEAMAAGTPVVATGIDGYRMVARNGNDARLFEADDIDALGTALNEMLSDGELAANYVVQGRQRAEEFSMRKLAESYVELYRRSLSRIAIDS